MTTRSSEFLDISSPTNQERLHRSRSGGYTDFLADKERWERRDRERDMKKYHDSRYGSKTLSPIIPSERTSADRLYVPRFDTSHRRGRSYDPIVERKNEEDSERGYKVREERPRSYDGSRAGSSAGVSPARLRDLPERPKRRETKYRRPSIKVQIHQDNAPRTPSVVAPRRSPGASPSPRSPLGQRQILFLSSMLQSRLAEIGQICHPNAHIEAADPRDLTFSEIAEVVEGFAFQFRVWSQIVNLENMERIDVTKRKNVELAARTLERILERIEELMVVCSRASPRDLKIEPLPDTDEEDNYGSYDDSDNEDDDHRYDPAGLRIAKQDRWLTKRSEMLEM
jgi:hypothetical protein